MSQVDYVRKLSHIPHKGSMLESEKLNLVLHLLKNKEGLGIDLFISGGWVIPSSAQGLFLAQCQLSYLVVLRDLGIARD